MYINGLINNYMHGIAIGHRQKNMPGNMHDNEAGLEHFLLLGQHIYGA